MAFDGTQNHNGFEGSNHFRIGDNGANRFLDGNHHYSGFSNYGQTLKNATPFSTDRKFQNGRLPEDKTADFRYEWTFYNTTSDRRVTPNFHPAQCSQAMPLCLCRRPHSRPTYMKYQQEHHVVPLGTPSIQYYGASKWNAMGGQQPEKPDLQKNLPFYHNPPFDAKFLPYKSMSSMGVQPDLRF